jgi:hypothetical protein
VTPHVLLFSSDLNRFVRVARGVVCVNPGRLVKRMHGGTYALVSVHPPKPADAPAPAEPAAGASAEDATSVAARTCVQIVRI